MEPTFRMSEAVKARIADAEAKEAEEAEKLEQAVQAAREAAMNDSLIEEQPVHGESDEDAEVPGENEEMRALKVQFMSTELTKGTPSRAQGASKGTKTRC